MSLLFRNISVLPETGCNVLSENGGVITNYDNGKADVYHYINGDYYHVISSNIVQPLDVVCYTKSDLSRLYTDFDIAVFFLAAAFIVMMFFRVIMSWFMGVKR